ncbi:hypothetical protein [Rhodococcus jostii]|uniref:hypothetical protein n=1 Tax=Rhodococcus jostii TaxID=132919 RepID=UPI0036350EDE
MTGMTRMVLAAVTAAVLASAGCGGDGTGPAPGPGSTAASTPTPPPAAVISCPTATAMTNPALAAVVASVPLPPGTQYTSARVDMDDDNPGNQAATVQICAPTITSADALRPLATDYATALKASPLAETLSTLSVSSAHLTNGQVTGTVTVTDPDFRSHP